jgi:signal transduction histidine kinase
VNDAHVQWEIYSRDMTGLAPARAWLAGHRLTADALLAVVVACLGFVPVLLSAGRDDSGLDPTPWLLPLMILASAPLVLRRRHAGAVWVATTAVGLVATVIEQGPSPAYLPAVVALYTLATASPLRVTLAATAVTAVAPRVITGLQGSTIVDAAVYGLTAWCGLAAASGVAVQFHRAVVEEAQERARQAEATRDEVAQRRVTEERLRIAQELHDVVAHHVAVINVQAGVASHLVRSDPEKALESLGHVREASQVVLREVPGLLGLLRSGDELERKPAPRLADAEELVEAARRSGLEVTWRTPGSPVALAPGADLTAYRVLQEALTNVARHGAGSALVELTHDAEGCTLEVRNERPRETHSAGSERHGLVGMRERVAAVGGRLTVGPEGERDWVVRVWLPAQREPALEVS